MPGSARRKRAIADEEYESDGGFVEDAPKQKRTKKGDNKATANRDAQVDDDGNQFWELSGKRRIQVSDFKGNTMVGIREFYEANGKVLPGKKIERSLEAKGIKVPRPIYDALDKRGTSNNDEHPDLEDEVKEDDDDDDHDEKPPPAVKSSSKLEKYRMKQNHEATSDEDDG